MNSLLTFVATHKEVLMLLIGWPLITGIANFLLQWKTPEEWESFVARNPTGAFFVKALRKSGLDLAGLIRLWKARLDAKAGRVGGPVVGGSRGPARVSGPGASPGPSSGA